MVASKITFVNVNFNINKMATPTQPRPFSKLQLFHSCPYAISIKNYNKIPMNLKSEDDSKKIKIALKKYLITKKYYTLQEFFNEKI